MRGYERKSLPSTIEKSCESGQAPSAAASQSLRGGAVEPGHSGFQQAEEGYGVSARVTS